MASDKVKNLLQVILTGITDTEIEINIRETEQIIIAEIKPNSVVLSKWIIGRDGKTIDAIRRIFDTVAHKVNKRIIIEVI
jgi:predicted RNA-binding protein YlqC (UPF0109 family)